MRRPVQFAAIAMLMCVARASTSDGGFDAGPWLQDLQQVQVALTTKYANLDWVVFEREADLPRLFADARTRIGRASSDFDARAAIERLIGRLGDAHVEVGWPSRPTSRSTPSRSAEAPAPAALCSGIGYVRRTSSAPVGGLVAGFRPIADSTDSDFPAGTLDVSGKRVGIVRIAEFSPARAPALCESALKALRIAPETVCDDACRSRVEKWAYTRMSRDLAESIDSLEKAGSSVLLVDITGNGGGSEWAEAAARMLTPMRLRSEEMQFVRGEHWTRKWSALAADLRKAAKDADEAGAAQLSAWAEKVDEKTKDAATACPGDAYWSRRRPGCHWLGAGFFATGLLGDADVAALRKHPWGALVFTPAQYDFPTGVWHGPLLVLVDQRTYSAAEEFAAVLQDNGVAIILGAATGGAGCGRTDGGTPTLLKNSGGTLQVPDCARIRRNGANEVSGIDPDVLIGFRDADGATRRGIRLLGALPRAIAIAGARHIGAAWRTGQ